MIDQSSFARELLACMPACDDAHASISARWLCLRAGIMCVGRTECKLMHTCFDMRAIQHCKSAQEDAITRDLDIHHARMSLELLCPIQVLRGCYTWLHFISCVCTVSITMKLSLYLRYGDVPFVLTKQEMTCVTLVDTNIHTLLDAFVYARQTGSSAASVAQDSKLRDACNKTVAIATR